MTTYILVAMLLGIAALIAVRLIGFFR